LSRTARQFIVCAACLSIPISRVAANDDRANVAGGANAQQAQGVPICIAAGVFEGFCYGFDCLDLYLYEDNRTGDHGP